MTVVARLGVAVVAAAALAVPAAVPPHAGAMTSDGGPHAMIVLPVAYHYVPQTSDTVTLPAEVTCADAATGGTACKKNTDGTTTLYYVGWASTSTHGYGAKFANRTQFEYDF